LDIECLCCLKEKEASIAIKEIFSVLKPGGIFISRAFDKSSIGYGTGEKLEQNTFICDEGPIVLNFILVNLPSCSSKHEEFLILLVIDDLPSMLG
jgi:hypothetical protein